MNETVHAIAAILRLLYQLSLFHINKPYQIIYHGQATDTRHRAKNFIRNCSR